MKKRNKSFSIAMLCLFGLIVNVMIIIIGIDKISILVHQLSQWKMFVTVVSTKDIVMFIIEIIFWLIFFVQNCVCIGYIVFKFLKTEETSVNIEYIKLLAKEKKDLKKEKKKEKLKEKLNDLENGE